MGMVKMIKYDDVNGQIIGGDYGLCWVTYEGRKQGSTGFPTNEIEAERFCLGVVERIKIDCGEHFGTIFPNKDGWKFHFDGI